MLGFATTVSRCHFASGCMQKSGCYIEGCNEKHMTVVHPPERSLPARQETNETHKMKNNEAHPGNQSHARESAKHTIQNHVIGAGIRNSGRITGALGTLENRSCEGARKATMTSSGNVCTFRQ